MFATSVPNHVLRCYLNPVRIVGFLWIFAVGFLNGGNGKRVFLTFQKEFVDFKPKTGE